MDIILFYNFNSLIWLTGIVEVVSTCSRQPKLITCSKNDNNNYNVPFLHVFNWRSNKHKQTCMTGEAVMSSSHRVLLLINTPAARHCTTVLQGTTGHQRSISFIISESELSQAGISWWPWRQSGHAYLRQIDAKSTDDAATAQQRRASVRDAGPAFRQQIVTVKWRFRRWYVLLNSVRRCHKINRTAKQMHLVGCISHERMRKHVPVHDTSTLCCFYVGPPSPTLA